jgi:hypothetical protein
MNQAIQSGNHPDAESLNAFVEQALTGTEREQVLAHMATCGRCRQVVYLAQEAAGIEGQVGAPVVSGEGGREKAPNFTQRHNWFGGWRLAWIPVAALAGFVGFAVLQHARHTPVESQVAINSPQEKAQQGAPSSRATNSNAVDRTEAGSKKAQSSAPEFGLARAKSAPERSDSNAPIAKFDAVERAKKPAERSADSVTRSSQNEGDKARDPADVSNSVGAVYLSHQEAQEEALKKTGALDKDEQRREKENKQLQTAQVSVVGGTGMPPSAPPVGQAGSGSFGAAARPAANAPVANGQPALSASNYKGATAGKVMADLKAKRTLLPNGTAALSVTTAKGRMVALDPSGTMYMTEDAGKSWVVITSQWTGRAVLVRTRETPVQANAITPNNNAMFELVNDNLQTWMSSDGKIWVPQVVPLK